MLSESNYVTQPLTRQSIRKDTYQIRKSLDMLDETYFPIVQFIEIVLPKTIDPDFQLEVVPDNDLPGRLAESCPNQHVIRVKQVVYDGACQGHHWHRMTLAHELAHYLYHGEGNVKLARLDFGKKIPYNCNPEIQADIFAAELLMPIENIKGMTYIEVAKSCGVSYAAAKNQLKVIQNLEKKKKPKRLKRFDSCPA